MISDPNRPARVEDWRVLAEIAKDRADAQHQLAIDAVKQVGRDPNGLTYFGLLQELGAAGVQERAECSAALAENKLLRDDNKRLRELLRELVGHTGPHWPDVDTELGARVRATLSEKE
jgi:hypothetical protein